MKLPRALFSGTWYFKFAVQFYGILCTLAFLVPLQPWPHDQGQGNTTISADAADNCADGYPSMLPKSDILTALQRNCFYFVDT